MLVTLPEEMPVSETVEAAYQLEDQAGVQLGPVVVNGCDAACRRALATDAEAAAGQAGVPLHARLSSTALEAARQFRLHRHELQAEQVERLAGELPLPQLRLPALVGPGHRAGRARAALAAALAAGVGPSAPSRRAA